MLSLKKFSALALTLAASSAFATAVVPTYTTFGTLTGANFGGSGIPNNAVAITTSTALNGVTLGLTATQRFSSPAVMNNGAGVFQAVGGAFAAGDNLAKWSFNFYVGGTNLRSFTYKLFGDYNASVGDDQSSYTDISAYLSVADSLLTGGTIQNSENLGFNTNLAQFNPSTGGEYGFILAAFNGSAEVGRSAILVNVAQVPEPASLALVGIAMLGMVGGLRRSRR